MKGIQVSSNKGPGCLQRGDDKNKCKNGVGHLKISKTTRPILNRFDTNPGGREFLKFGIALLQGEIIAKEKNTLKFFKNLLQNQLAKINQTWNKLFLVEGISSLSK
jgi:hypothetical protein